MEKREMIHRLLKWLKSLMKESVIKSDYFKNWIQGIYFEKKIFLSYVYTFIKVLPRYNIIVWKNLLKWQEIGTILPRKFKIYDCQTWRKFNDLRQFSVVGSMTW